MTIFYTTSIALALKSPSIKIMKIGEGDGPLDKAASNAIFEFHVNVVMIMVSIFLVNISDYGRSLVKKVHKPPSISVL